MMEEIVMSNQTKLSTKEKEQGVFPLRKRFLSFATKRKAFIQDSFVLLQFKSITELENYEL